MTIKDFIFGYTKTLDKDKEKFLAKHIKSHYLSYAMKIAEAEQIIQHTCYVDVNGSQRFRNNTPLRYVVFVQAVLRNYTDLEFSENVLEDFDKLEENYIVEAVFAAIGDDVDRFQTVLNMMLDDVQMNERALVPFVEGKLDALSIIMAQLGEAYEASQAAEE